VKRDLELLLVDISEEMRERKERQENIRLVELLEQDYSLESTEAYRELDLQIYSEGDFLACADSVEARRDPFMSYVFYKLAMDNLSTKGGGYLAKLCEAAYAIGNYSISIEYWKRYGGISAEVSSDLIVAVAKCFRNEGRLDECRRVLNEGYAHFENCLDDRVKILFQFVKLYDNYLLILSVRNHFLRLLKRALEERGKTDESYFANQARCLDIESDPKWTYGDFEVKERWLPDLCRAYRINCTIGRVQGQSRNLASLARHCGNPSVSVSLYRRSVALLANDGHQYRGLLLRKAQLALSEAETDPRARERLRYLKTDLACVKNTVGLVGILSREIWSTSSFEARSDLLHEAVELCKKYRMTKTLVYLLETKRELLKKKIESDRSGREHEELIMELKNVQRDWRKAILETIYGYLDILSEPEIYCIKMEAVDRDSFARDTSDDLRRFLWRFERTTNDLDVEVDSYVDRLHARHAELQRAIGVLRHDIREYATIISKDGLLNYVAMVLSERLSMRDFVARFRELLDCEEKLSDLAPISAYQPDVLDLVCPPHIKTTIGTLTLNALQAAPDGKCSLSIEGSDVGLDPRFAAHIVIANRGYISSEDKEMILTRRSRGATRLIEDVDLSIDTTVPAVVRVVVGIPRIEGQA